MWDTSDTFNNIVVYIRNVFSCFSSGSYSQHAFSLTIYIYDVPVNKYISFNDMHCEEFWKPGYYGEVKHANWIIIIVYCIPQTFISVWDATCPDTRVPSHIALAFGLVHGKAGRTAEEGWVCGPADETPLCPHWLWVHRCVWSWSPLPFSRSLAAASGPVLVNSFLQTSFATDWITIQQEWVIMDSVLILV